MIKDDELKQRSAESQQEPQAAAVTELSPECSSAEMGSQSTHNDKNAQETVEEACASQDSVADATSKPVVSLRNVESNRRNAKKSTGPRTARGKKIVGRNATKHGFFSKVLLISDEDPAEYGALRASLREDYQPVGGHEERLVGGNRGLVLAASPSHTL